MTYRRQLVRWTLLLSLFLIVAGAAWAQGATNALQRVHADRTDYRTWDDYIDELRRMESLYPDIAKLHVLGTSLEGRPIYALEISNALGVRDGRPETMHNSMIHAREWPAGELALDLAWYLLHNYGRDDRVTHIVEQIRTWILPMLNPDGFVHSKTEYTMWRKNRRDTGDGNFGIDLNRNMSYLWRARGSANTAAITYWGSAPFSEPENIVFKDFVLNRNFITTLNGHTYLEVIYGPSGDVDPEQKIIIDTLVELTGYEDRSDSTRGAGQGGFLYGVARILNATPEYGKEFIPPYEGYGAPGLQTDAFGMLEANLMKWAVPVEHVSGRLVHAGYGRPGDFPAAVTGNIALIERGGGYTYTTKAQNAVNAGAKAAIIYNNEPGFMRLPALAEDNGVPIPIIVLPGETGRQLAQALGRGQTINADIVPDVFVQDSYQQVWDRNIEAFLFMIEMAAEFSSVVRGNVVNKVTGQPLAAQLTSEVTAVAPLAGPFEGQFVSHVRRSAIDTEGSFAWHMQPSKQPYLPSDPYVFTASAPGFYPTKATLAVNTFREEHRLDFALQPVAEFISPYVERQTWPVSSVVPVHFITVDPLGRPTSMDHVTVELQQDGALLATVAAEPGPNPGQYNASLDTGALNLAPGNYTLTVSFTGPHGNQTLASPLALADAAVGLALTPAQQLAVAAIQALPAYVTLENKNQVVQTRIITDAAGISADGSPAAEALAKLEAAEARLRILAEAEAALNTAAEMARGAVAALPATVTIEHRGDVEEARGLVDTALRLGVPSAALDNMDLLVQAEAALEAIVNELAAPVVAAVDALPVAVTVADRETIAHVRSQVASVLAQGLRPADIAGLSRLEAAEAELERQYDATYDKVSLFALGDPGTAYRDGMGWFVDYHNPDRWVTTTTIDTTSYSPLKVFNASFGSLSTRPRWIEYNIAGRGIEFIQGYVGISDQNSNKENPLDFVIFVDGEPAFQAHLEYGYPATFYRLDVREAETLKIQWSAQTVSENGWANRIALVEPQLLIPAGTQLQPAQPRQDDGPIASPRTDQRERVGLTSLPDPGAANRNSLGWFVDYAGRWNTGRTINGVSYDPLRAYDQSHGNLHTNPRWIEYDISDRGFESVEGYVGISDTNSNRDYPLDFKIYLDGELAFAARLEYGQDAHFYDLPLTGVSKIKFYWSAEQVSANDFANRLVLVEPQFVLPAEPGSAETAEGDTHYEWVGLLSLPDPGTANRNSLGWFVDYEGRWNTGRTINGISYDPLKAFDQSMGNLHTNPRWIEYDISSRGFDLVEGYMGISDTNTNRDYPLDFKIYLDGELAFEARLEYGQDAHFYRLPLIGVSKIKFYWSAETVSDNNFANRLVLVEPQFRVGK